MTEIIVTVGQMIASESEISKLLKRKVTNYWVNFGLMKNSFGYICLLHKMKKASQVPLNIYLELPGSRCRHIKKIGDIKEDKTYMLYDGNAKRDGEQNYMLMSGLQDIMDDLVIGEKIYYEDGLCICSIKQIDKNRKRLLISCDISCDANSMISEGSAVSFNGFDKSYEVLRDEDRNFLKRMQKDNMLPDFFVVSFCKNKDDVIKARNEITTILGCDIKLLAKIQNQSSVKNIDEIINSTEGVVIERGDLLYVLDDYQLPYIQHMIIEKTKQEKKIAIVASGFMSEFSRTSIMNRSEQSDVYRLKEECGDFLLLTKETGKAPHAFATIDAIQKILELG